MHNTYIDNKIENQTNILQAYELKSQLKHEMQKKSDRNEIK